MSNIISLKDIEQLEDKMLVQELKKTIYHRMNAGPKGTRIIMRDLNTGKESELHNKVVISGSAAVASSMFGIELPAIPTYNEALELENSVYDVEPENHPLICLFGVADDGCGALDSDVFSPSYVDRIAPADLYPFRYIEPGDADLSDSEREIYYGRKVDELGGIFYYFKAFDNEPQLYLRYTDGTEITPGTMYNVVTTQEAECYVQLDLSINRLDFREFFDKILGWDKARISSLSLVYAWYTMDDNNIKWYQSIIPFTKLNFSFEKLVDSSRALAFEYSIFF